MSTSQDAQAKSNFHISMHQSKLKHKCLPLDATVIQAGDYTAEIQI
jgi:hypothetical protein